MRKRICLFALMMVAVLAALPAQAAGGAWSVWLYTQMNGRLRQIDDTGALLRDITVALPADANAGGFPNSLAISHDGNLIAYVVRANADNAPRVLVWDVQLATHIASYVLPPNVQVSLELSASPLNFSESDSQIAFSYGYEAGGWQVVILDLVSGATFILDSSSPAAAGIPATPFLVPIVQVYRGATVFFNLLPVPSDAMSGPSYAWDTIAGTVAPTPAYATFGDTLLMTGEYITSVADDRFPYSAAPLAFPMIQFNTIQVYDPTIGGLFPYYTDAESSFYNPRFIQNGERIAVRGDRTDGTGFLALLERDGTWIGETGVPASSLQGVFNGFVFTTTEPALVSAPNSTALFYTETRGGLPATAGTFIWNSPANEYVTIVWNSDNFAVGPASPLGWAILAEPSYAPIPALGAPPLPSATPAVFVVPTVAPTFAPATIVPAGMAVGADAFVHTTEGDQLRMRSGPGTSYSIVRELADGTRVTLLEGPRSGEGYVWWRIRLADGTSGWVVESADGVQTLVPVYAG